MEANNEQLNQLLVLGGLAVANLAGIVGSWISMRIAIAELKVEVKRNTKDIDGIASFVGTPTAFARIRSGASEGE